MRQTFYHLSHLPYTVLCCPYVAQGDLKQTEVCVV